MALNDALATEMSYTLESHPVSQRGTQDEFPLEGPAFMEAHYPIERQERSPTVTLRVTDESGKITEIPVDFSEARLEPRGFWGDVAMNGMTLFIVSICIIIVKEFLTWSAAKRKKARAAAQRTKATQRRGAISAQLEAAETEINKMLAVSPEDIDNKFGDNARRLLELLNAYRDELTELDAPALMAYVDSLITQAIQLLRKHNGTQVEREITERSYDLLRERLERSGIMGRRGVRERGPGAAPHPSFASVSTSESEIPPTSPRPSDGQVPSIELTHDDNETGTEGEDTDKVSQRQEDAEGKDDQKIFHPLLAQPEQPDMEIVQQILMQRPGMHPSDVIRLAKELTQKQRQNQFRNSP